GGTYHYLREIFQGSIWGRLLPFLFIWQFLISGTMEVATGYIGASKFTLSLVPDFSKQLIQWGVPNNDVVTGIVAAAMVVILGLLLCQRIRSLGWLGTLLVTVVLGTVGTIVILGFRNFDPALLTFPPAAFRIDKKFLVGIGAATSVAVYDYLGYYN